MEIYSGRPQIKKWNDIGWKEKRQIKEVVLEDSVGLTGSQMAVHKILETTKNKSKTNVKS